MAFYTRSVLLNIRNFLHSRGKLSPLPANVWITLKSFAIAKKQRGCRAGVRHKKFMFHMACKEFRKGFLNENTTTTTNEVTTLIRPRITGMADCTPRSRILSPLTRRMEHSHRITPKCMIVNSRSLVKPGAIQSLQEDLSSQHIDLCFISETWLHERFEANLICPNGFSLLAKNRINRIGGGVAIARRNPVYNPDELIEHLSDGLETLLANNPGCRVILAGYINQLKLNTLMHQFSLSQLVKKPTRGNNIMDVFLTNTPFEFSAVKCVNSLINTDHKSIIVNPRTRAKATRKWVQLRDTRAHCKLAMFDFLKDINWLAELSGKNIESSRPIVSACSCPTELISSYLDKVMTPIVKSLPSYIKDSNHALETFRNFNFSGENKIIFTMDITSLYTVIPNNEGLQALKYFFNQLPIKKPSSETLLRLAELVLTLNCFSFGDNYYKQINGVAMGTKMGPSYANLFVGFIENKFFSNYHGPKPDLYKRYIDDCVGATSSSKEELNLFINSVNSFHPALKYTWEISENSLAYLDIKLSINDNGLSTSVHYKPTDSHNYLLHLSSHPQHIKNAIPFSQFLRLRRLCSEDTDFNNARKCASFSKNAATLTPLSPQANTAPKKSTERPHYKLHRTKKPTEFHSHLPTTHKTSQSKMSFSKTSKFSAMIPKLNTYFLYHRSFHSNATKT